MKLNIMAVLAYVFSLSVVGLAVLYTCITFLFWDAPNTYPTAAYNTMVNFIIITVLSFPLAFLLKIVHKHFIFLPLAGSIPLLVLLVLLSMGILKYSEIDYERKQYKHLFSAQSETGKELIHKSYQDYLKDAKKDFVCSDGTVIDILRQTSGNNFVIYYPSFANKTYKGGNQTDIMPPPWTMGTLKDKTFNRFPLFLQPSEMQKDILDHLNGCKNKAGKTFSELYVIV